MLPLPKHLLNLLQECFTVYRSDLLWIIKEDQINDLDESLKEEIEDILTNEFSLTGLREDGEPNERGVMLDELIYQMVQLMWPERFLEVE